MSTVAGRVAEAVARQEQWESDVEQTIEPHVVAFLRSVIDEAVKALDAPVLLAAADPFAFTNIRKRWDTAVRLILHSTPAGRLAHPALLDEQVARMLRAADIPDRAAGMAADLLIRSRDENWTSAKTKRELRAAILPPAPKVQGPKAESKEWAWYKARVRAIARTAATRASSLYVLEGDDGSAHKRWVTVRDDDVRTSHAQAHNQTVARDAAFTVGGYAMQYPGDPAAPPELTHNCRCVLIMVDGNDEDAMTETPTITEADWDAWAGPMVASAADGIPPAEWFDNPNLSGPTRLTVTDDGRVFGHIATWDTCHTGFPGECVPPPRSPTGYAEFHNSPKAFRVRTASGQVERITVGKLTAGTGHAALEASPEQVVAHYDHTGTAVAYVRCGEDQFGIWASGMVRPGATPEQLLALETSPPSGDWRDRGNGLDLLAVLCVNTPGFPVPLAASAAGQPFALVSAGMLLAEVPELPGAELEYIRKMMRTDTAALLASRVQRTRAKAKVDGFAAKRRKERGKNGMSVSGQ